MEDLGAMADSWYTGFRKITDRNYWSYTVLPVQIGCIEHIMTMPWSDRKFAGGVYPYDEKVFAWLLKPLAR